jgi:hypothetical protein
MLLVATDAPKIDEAKDVVNKILEQTRKQQASE